MTLDLNTNRSSVYETLERNGKGGTQYANPR